MVPNRSSVDLNELAINRAFRKRWSTFCDGYANFIIDLALEVIEDPIALGQELDHVSVGVVEHGLFNQWWIRSLLDKRAFRF